MPSSMIRVFYYTPQKLRLDVMFVSGRRYSYHGVRSAVYDSMVRAFSKGEFFNAHIRDCFRFTPHPQRHAQSR
jgi:hypothetical protein